MGIEQPHILLQAHARGLEAGDLGLQHSGALDQPATRLEAAFTFDGMVGEVRQRAQAEKRHQELPRPGFSPIMHEGDAKPLG